MGVLCTCWEGACAWCMHCGYLDMHIRTVHQDSTSQQHIRTVHHNSTSQYNLLAYSRHVIPPPVTHYSPRSPQPDQGQQWFDLGWLFHPQDVISNLSHYLTDTLVGDSPSSVDDGEGTAATQYVGGCMRVHVGGGEGLRHTQTCTHTCTNTLIHVHNQQQVG